MSRTALNFALDALLLTITVALLFVSAVLRFVFPLPTEASGWELWGHGYDGWANVQFGLLCLIAMAILLHVMLHWSWVCSVALTRLAGKSAKEAKLDDGTRTIYGVGLLIVLLTMIGICVAVASLTIHSPAV
jgi:hypothetical protein